MNLIVLIKSTNIATVGEKRKKIKKQLKKKSKYKNNKYIFFWISAVSIFFLFVTHSPPLLPKMPSNTRLVSGPAVVAAQALIWSYCCVFLPPMSTSRCQSQFVFFCGSFRCPCIHPIGHRVSPVDLLDLTCHLYSWWEAFGSSSLAILSLCFNCGFISTSVCESSTRLCSWVCPGAPGSASVRARCEGGTVAWITRAPAAPGTQEPAARAAQNVVP